MNKIRKIITFLLVVLMVNASKSAAMSISKISSSQKVSIAVVATALLGVKLYMLYHNACIDQQEIKARHLRIVKELVGKNIPIRDAGQLINYLDQNAPTIGQVNHLYDVYTNARHYLNDHGYAMDTVKRIAEAEQGIACERSWWHYMQSFLS